VQDQTERADDVALVVVREPYIKKGILRALRGEALRLLVQCGCVLRVFRGRFSGIQQQSACAMTVELARIRSHQRYSW
jgi:hypothetical protein